MSTPTADPTDRLQAESDYNDILALRKNLPFNRYFMREAGEQVAQLETALTDPEKPMKKKDRQKALGMLAVWRRIVNKLDHDEVGKRSILGIEGDERPLEGRE